MLKDMGLYPWHAAIAQLAGGVVPSYANQAGVNEDGTVGIVRFRFETLDSGTAKLLRGERAEPLWDGRQIHVQTAYSYSCRFNHAFQALRA